MTSNTESTPEGPENNTSTDTDITTGITTDIITTEGPTETIAIETTATTEDVTTSIPETSTQNNNGDLSTGAIAGIATAAALFLVVIVIVIILLLRKQRRGRKIRRPTLAPTIDEIREIENITMRTNEQNEYSVPPTTVPSNLTQAPDAIRSSTSPHNTTEPVAHEEMSTTDPQTDLTSRQSDIPLIDPTVDDAPRPSSCNEGVPRRTSSKIDYENVHEWQTKTCHPNPPKTDPHYENLQRLHDQVRTMQKERDNTIDNAGTNNGASTCNAPAAHTGPKSPKGYVNVPNSMTEPQTIGMDSANYSHTNDSTNIHIEANSEHQNTSPSEPHYVNKPYPAMQKTHSDDLDYANRHAIHEALLNTPRNSND